MKARVIQDPNETFAFWDGLAFALLKHCLKRCLLLGFLSRISKSLYIASHYICNTMNMELTQVRLPSKLVAELDRFVKQGYYASKSDLIRDAIRRLLLERQVGSIPDTGDSVRQVRAIRQKLSKEDLDIDAINKL
ncbi:ribbon-helix-helix domain-containing protein [bacterium]|nr:ribbon-helix-helix domain-containing protein [bacterium]